MLAVIRQRWVATTTLLLAPLILLARLLKILPEHGVMIHHGDHGNHLQCEGALLLLTGLLGLLALRHPAYRALLLVCDRFGRSDLIGIHVCNPSNPTDQTRPQSSVALMTEEELLVLSKACGIPEYGTWGCILRDRHPGLHKFALSGKRKRTCTGIANINHTGADDNTVSGDQNDVEAAAEELKQLKHMRQFPKSAGRPLQQIIIKVDNDGSIIVPGTLIVKTYHGNKPKICNMRMHRVE